MIKERSLRAEEGEEMVGISKKRRTKIGKSLLLFMNVPPRKIIGINNSSKNEDNNQWG